MSQCNSQADLHREMARVYDFCAGTVFEGREHLCVKRDGEICSALQTFFLAPSRYEFAFGIVEDMLVWADSALYLPNGLLVSAGGGTPISVILASGSWNPPAPPKPKTVSISVNGGEPTTLDEMVDRFLSWKLPEHFHPDAGISFIPDYNVGTPYPMKHEPVGTNLFGAEQARAMLLYLLQGKK